MSKFDFISKRELETFDIDSEVYKKALKTIEALAKEIPVGVNDFYKEIKIPLIDYLKEAVEAREFRVTQRPKLHHRNNECEFLCEAQFTRDYYVFKNKDDNRYLQVKFCFPFLSTRIRELRAVSMKHVMELYHPANGFTSFEKRIPTLHIAELNTISQYVDDFREDSYCDQKKLSNFLQVTAQLAEVLDEVVDRFA